MTNETEIIPEDPPELTERERDAKRRVELMESLMPGWTAALRRVFGEAMATVQEEERA